MDKKNIAILFGGMSAEYPISLQSAHAVITHLDTDKYTPILVGITQNGEWLRYRGGAEAILNDSWNTSASCTPAFISPCRRSAGLVELGAATVFTRLDAAFPVMHGPLGEDGTVQGLLELAGIPIVGCGTTASALCMDKDIAHLLVQSTGVTVPASHSFSRGAAPEKIHAAASTLGYPLFVKPVRAGSSFGISQVENETELDAAVHAAFAYDTRILLEVAVEGFEVGCAVLGDETLTIGEPDEVELASGFFNFDEKYSLATSRIHVPARVAPEKREQLKQTAAAIYRRLGCSGFARVDMFLRPTGEIVFSEVNTIPGFTPHSRYPGMMKAAGLDFATLVERLLEAAVETVVAP